MAHNGSIHIDLAEVPTADGRLCLFVAVDRTSTSAFVELHRKALRKTAADVLRHLVEAVPCRINIVPGHPLTEAQGLTVADLAAFPFVVSTEGTPTRDAFDRLFDEARIAPASPVGTGSMILMRELPRRSDDIGCISRVQVQAEISSGAPVVLPSPLARTGPPDRPDPACRLDTHAGAAGVRRGREDQSFGTEGGPERRRCRTAAIVRTYGRRRPSAWQKGSPLCHDRVSIANPSPATEGHLHEPSTRPSCLADLTAAVGGPGAGVPE